jgi:hypothetical protein
MPTISWTIRRAALLSLAWLPAWAAQVTGTVKDANGQPVRGALVVTAGNGAFKDANGARHRWVATSDAAGRFSFADFSPTDCEVTANAGAAGLGRANCKPSDGQSSVDVVVTLKPESTRASGRVVRHIKSGRTPLDVVLLTLTSANEEAPVIYGVRLQGDNWSTELPAGSWSVRAVTPQMASGTAYFVLPGLTSALRLDLAHPHGSNPALARELDEMYEKDQQVRLTFLAAGKDDEETRKPMLDLDEVNLARLQQIVRQYGWPDAAMVGSNGVFDVFMLAQHQPELIPVALPHLRAAADRRELSWSMLAMMIDRDLADRHQPQMYATQFEFDQSGHIGSLPIQDPEHVDERRARVGLGPLAEYLATSAKSMSGIH